MTQRQFRRSQLNVWLPDSRTSLLSQAGKFLRSLMWYQPTLCHFMFCGVITLIGLCGSTLSQAREQSSEDSPEPQIVIITDVQFVPIYEYFSGPSATDLNFLPTTSAGTPSAQKKLSNRKKQERKKQDLKSSSLQDQ